MAQIIKEITVDVAKRNLFQAIVAKQHDSNSRFLKVTLTNEGTTISVDTNSVVTINASRADGLASAFVGVVNADGTVTVPLTTWMLELDDLVKCDIAVVDSESRRLTSTSFELEVETAAYSGDEIMDDENADLLLTLVSDYAQLKQRVESLENNGSSGGNGNSDSTQNAALTTAQINALDGMFKVCAFTKDDVSAEYTAFKTAFGITDSGDTHSHSYTSSVTTAATCETAGVRTYTCSCGNSYTEEIPATGHNYVDGVCTVCGAADPDYNPEVTLSSISVTYNGGDVAVGTALTDLTGIVVTAHYSDGTSEAVAGYTLSGTIAEGSNTVTVTYQGMTTAFAVTGVAESGGDDVATWTSGVPYDKNVIDGEYVAQTDGSITKYSGWARTDYLNCYGASKVAWSGVTYNSTYNAFYDGDKSFISSFKTQTSEESEIEVPTNAVYVVFSATSDSVNRMVITPYE